MPLIFLHLQNHRGWKLKLCQHTGSFTVYRLADSLASFQGVNSYALCVLEPRSLRPSLCLRPLCSCRPVPCVCPAKPGCSALPGSQESKRIQFCLSGVPVVKAGFFVFILTSVRRCQPVVFQSEVLSVSHVDGPFWSEGDDPRFQRPGAGIRARLSSHRKLCERGLGSCFPGLALAYFSCLSAMFS